MNLLLEKMFQNRGYSFEYLQKINEPGYDKLKDIDKLIVRLKEIHDAQIPITWYPDFDMDGICSGSLGFGGMVELGFNTRLYIPDPKRGYGFDAASIDDLLSQYPDTKVIITCDTGIGCSEGIKRCHERGIEIIVTDHHIQEYPTEADIVVDPLRMDETYSHPGICGAFVVYQILQHFADTYGTYFEQDQIRRLRVLAGFGTVSDVMPLLYENRSLVRDAVAICRLVYGNCDSSIVSRFTGSIPYRKIFWGIYYILKMYADHDVIKNVSDINEEFFGFYLAPTFNSAKRMNGDMRRAFSVFFGNTQYEDASYLFELNSQRKILVDTEYQKILNSTQPYAPYIYTSDAPGGILGLLAMKLFSVSGQPTFVVNDAGVGSDHRYSGSGRAPDWFDCRDSIGQLSTIAGHASAFGFSVNDADTMDQVFEKLKADVPAQYDKAVEEGLLKEERPDYVVSTDWTGDAGIDVELFYNYVQEREQYRPYGKDFPAPQGVFTFRDRDVSEWKQMGRAKEHLKLVFHSGFSVICWKQGYMIRQRGSGNVHRILGDFSISTYKDEESINFIGTFLED